MNRRRGFTLIEVMTAMVFLGSLALLMAAIDFFLEHTEDWWRS